MRKHHLVALVGNGIVHLLLCHRVRFSEVGTHIAEVAVAIIVGIALAAGEHQCGGKDGKEVIFHKRLGLVISLAESFCKDWHTFPTTGGDRTRHPGWAGQSFAVCFLCISGKSVSPLPYSAR